jgi:hypothetical protein
VENAVLAPLECAFLNRDVVDDVNGLDFDTRIREGGEPAAEECGAGRLSLAIYTPRRLEDDVVGKDLGARPLAARVREELKATGARPRREWRTGLEALSPRELAAARSEIESFSKRLSRSRTATIASQRGPQFG